MTADRSGSSRAHSRPGTTEGSSCARQMTLPAAGQAARLARQATRQVLASWQVAHLEETAVLLVGELVTNVVRHARTASPMVLRFETAGACLRIEVQDADPCWPQPRTPAGLDESGFGFVLVDTLADKWGVRETPPGKTVWAELDTRRRGEPGIGTDR
jgi:anti-sigma regulatory factor (Ser/Thr protein kinase)